jgi:hypothetical protein
MTTPYCIFWCFLLGTRALERGGSAELTVQSASLRSRRPAGESGTRLLHSSILPNQDGSSNRPAPPMPPAIHIEATT